MEPVLDGDPVHVEVLPQGLQGHDGGVSPDQLIAVERSQWSGHVYNLETRLGYYVAEGIITHNCQMTAYEFEEGYRYHQARNTGEIASEKPIDEHNHALKALGYYIVDRWGYSEGRSVLPKTKVVVPAYDRAFRDRQRAYARR